MEERNDAVTMKGDPITLIGPELKVGDRAPEFGAVDREWNTVSLSDFSGRPVLISAMVSVDTSVCSVQTTRFNQEADKLPDEVAILSISRDLPFALDRFCGAEDLERIHVLSDHVPGEFGPAYGVLIKDMQLLARAVFVVDKEGRLVYQQIVPEVTDHPDYDAALEAARKAAGEDG